ncbi:replication-relaxation family protein [Kitasatospora sp. NPDC048194]|uniref:replication-relaxation family protein n=1 Tax=Kitasatospora sp. NPDC048194 TaxID=3364045 RepID=UPI00371DC56C
MEYAIPAMEHQPPRVTRDRLGDADGAILRSVNRFQYVTAAQLGRLLYPNAHDDNRYMQRRLRRLADEGYLLRLRELPQPRVGSAPHVFTLADRGRKHLETQGVALASPYFRPGEEREKAQDNPFMEHTLAAVDVLIAADVLARDHPDVSIPRLFTERQLKRRAVHVQPAGYPDAPRTAVIPDAWFEVLVLDESVCVALELDRGTEQQKYWRRKISALTAWAIGSYRSDMQAQNLTVATVVPHTSRRKQLAAWTAQELARIGYRELCDVFLFTEVSPVEAPVATFFFSEVWFPAGSATPVALLDLPEEGQVS